MKALIWLGGMVLATLSMSFPVAAELAVGTHAPDFTENLCGPDGLTGRQFNLARDTAGKVVYLQFNSPTCSGSLNLIATVENEVLPRFKDDPDVAFVQVAYAYVGEGLCEVAKMIAATGCTQDVVAEKGGDIYCSYGITGVPSAFIIDREGVIRYAKKGARLGADEIAGEIGALIGDPAPSPDACLELICDGTTYRRGDALRIAVEIYGVSRPFDAYALVRMPDGSLLSVTAPNRFTEGVTPLAAGVPSHTNRALYTLADIAIPADAPAGAYEVIAGLTDPGTLDPFCEERIAGAVQ